jgi:hypothetical protein
VDVSSYMTSLCGDQALRQLGELGKSRSVFFLSHGGLRPGLGSAWLGLLCACAWLLRLLRSGCACCACCACVCGG